MKQFEELNRSIQHSYELKSSMQAIKSGIVLQGNGAGKSITLIGGAPRLAPGALGGRNNVIEYTDFGLKNQQKGQYSDRLKTN